MIVTNTCKPSRKAILKSYGPHIEPSSTIFHDQEKAHDTLVEAKNLKSITFPSSACKADQDPLAPINEYHGLLKRFMQNHSGFDRGRLQDWMNLFWFITNGPADHDDNIVWFFELAMKKKVNLRYRDRFKNIHQ